ncbi:hypothetical protein BpHYR1_004810 [Brachionus plicatilis]|uniref:Uncharacterized protein n=1 Tax=Brachionus plicatilis TaxID=10195 RepID=A0A3M7PCJ7_BRAPC|nr:hypothetical protein BpHYR1_004810 [Brachionus plicatilis]
MLPTKPSHVTLALCFISVCSIYSKSFAYDSDGYLSSDFTTLYLTDSHSNGHTDLILLLKFDSISSRKTLKEQDCSSRVSQGLLFSNTKLFPTSSHLHFLNDSAAIKASKHSAWR